MSDEFQQPGGPPPREDVLDRFVDEACEALEKDLERLPRPDFATMMTRAAELSPETISAEQLAQARELGRVEWLRPEDSGQGLGPLPEELGPFVCSARSELDRQLQGRELAPSRPPAPAPRALSEDVTGSQEGEDSELNPGGIVKLDQRRSALRRGALALVPAVAAVALLALGFSALRGLEAQVRGGKSSEAMDQAPGQEPTRSANELRPTRSRTNPVEGPPKVALSPTSGEESGEADEPPVGSEGSERSSTKVAPTLQPADRGAGSEGSNVAPPPPASAAHDKQLSLEDRLAKLDAEAQERWRQGELDAAWKNFQAILAIAPRHPRAELAYGDLFELARRRGDRNGEERMWAQYAELFPRGRYADDARAGLCRRNPQAQACWSRYLLDFPEGTHRREAEAALYSDPAPSRGRTP